MSIYKQSMVLKTVLQKPNMVTGLKNIGLLNSVSIVIFDLSRCANLF